MFFFFIFNSNHRSIYHCVPFYIIISNAEGTRHNLCWQVQLFLPHIPLLLLIKFDLYEDIADVLFISALRNNSQVPSGCHDLYVLNKNQEKKRQPLSLHLLVYTLMKFNEMKFSTTSIGVGHIILKCFITAVVVACGISSFGTWHASFITIRYGTKGHSVCRKTLANFVFISSH